MGVINPYSQPELEEKGWEFSSEDVKVKLDDGSVSEASLDDDLKTRMPKVYNFKGLAAPTNINNGYESITVEEWQRITGYPDFQILKDIAANGWGYISTPLDSGTNGSYFSILGVVKYKEPVGSFRVFILLKGTNLTGGYIDILEYFYVSDDDVKVGISRLRTTFATYKYFGGTLGESAMYKGLVSLLDKQILTDKIATGAVTWGKLADNAVHENNIAMESVTKDKLQVGAVGMEQLDRNVRDAISDAPSKSVLLQQDLVLGTLYTKAQFESMTEASFNDFDALSIDDYMRVTTGGGADEEVRIVVARYDQSDPQSHYIVVISPDTGLMTSYTFDTYEMTVTANRVSIGTDGIADNAVTQAKLSDDLQTAMSSISELIANGYVYDPSLNFKVEMYPFPKAPTAVPYGRFCTYYYKQTINQKPRVFGILKYEANSVDPIEAIYLEVLCSTSIINESNLDEKIKDKINDGSLRLKSLLPTSGTYTASQISSTIVKSGGIEALVKASSLLLDQVSTSHLTVGYTRIGNYEFAKGLSGKENDAVIKWMYLDSNYNLKFIQGVVPQVYTSITFSEIDSPFADPNVPKQYELTTSLEDETEMTPEAFLEKYGVSVDVIKGLRVADSLKGYTFTYGVVAVNDENPDYGIQLMNCAYDEINATYAAFITITEGKINISSYRLLHEDIEGVLGSIQLGVTDLPWGTTVQVSDGATAILNLTPSQWMNMQVGTVLVSLSSSVNIYVISHRVSDVLYLGMYNEPQTDGTAKQIQYSIRLRYNSDRTALTSISFYADEVGAGGVRYDEPQQLTDAEKAQVQKNIGVNTLFPTVVELPGTLSLAYYSTDAALKDATGTTFAMWNNVIKFGATLHLFRQGHEIHRTGNVTGPPAGDYKYIVDLGDELDYDGGESSLRINKWIAIVTVDDATLFPTSVYFRKYRIVDAPPL